MPTFSLTELQLAFSLHIADLILGDHATRDPDEAAFFERTFPSATLMDAGFRTADGTPTDRYHEAAMSALDTLPDALTDADKRGLLQVFVAAVMADGAVEAREARALVDGGRLLEMSDPALNDLLQSAFGLELGDLAEDDTLDEDGPRDVDGEAT